jgi:hypothetical protein
MSGNEPKLHYLLISFLGDENSSQFGKRVILDETIDYCVGLQLLWYKFTGLQDTVPTIPDEPMLYLDIQAGGESYADIHVNKTTSKPSKWIPMPVDRAPDSGAVHLEEPFHVSFRNAGDRKMEYFYAKVYAEDNTTPVFERCWAMFKVLYSSRLPQATTLL